MREQTPAWDSEDRVRVGFLVLGRKRPGFDPQWGRQMEAAARAIPEGDEFSAFWPQHHAVDDASLRAALDAARQAGCEVLVVLQPTMGEGRLAPILAQRWGDPLVFWATPERPDSLKVSSCSLVGTHVMATTLRQLGRRFELVYGHPADPATREELVAAVRLAALVPRLQRAKVGLVGAHAPGFINMHPDPALLSRALGLQLHTFSLQEFFDLVEGQEKDAVAADVAWVESLGLPYGEGVGPADLPANSRYYLALRALAEGENLDALALRCWPELPRRFGQWPYLAMSRFADEGRIVALEGDVDGAVTCLLASRLGLGVGYLSDWLEHDREAILLWHPGHAPLAICRRDRAWLGRHFNTDQPLVVNAPLAVDRPVTLTRLWHCDGQLQMTACDAQTVAPRRELLGVYGEVALGDRDVHEWFVAMCHEGMPHHLALLAGHHARLLRRAAQTLGITWH